MRAGSARDGACTALCRGQIAVKVGFNNLTWDEEFTELLQNDPVALTRMTHSDHARLGGMESSEVVMWLLMRGGLSASVECIHRSYYLPSMTAIATAIYENKAEP